MKSIEEIRDLFKNDRFALENGMVIDEVGDNYAKCSLKLEERHQNALGCVMGGAIFTLADFAFGVAANKDKMGTVSVSSSIAFLGVPKGERLIAEAKCVKNGRTTCYYTVSVTDELGTKVAEVTVTGFNKA